jgi:hypothetical protein
MAPADYVVLRSLPRTPAGKIDRLRLEPPASAATSVEAYNAPTTVSERVLAAIWADVLGVDRIGTLDGFFERGGHSLLATTMLARVRKVFRVDIPLRAMYEGEPTIGALREYLIHHGGGVAVVEEAAVTWRNASQHDVLREGQVVATATGPGSSGNGTDLPRGGADS